MKRTRIPPGPGATGVLGGLSKRRYWWGVGAGVLVVVLAVAWWGRPAEPRHDGRALCSWLDEMWMSSPGTPERERAEAAIRAMGTDALPALARYLEALEPRWRVWLRVQGFWPDALGVDGGTVRWRLAIGAAEAVGVLGADAEVLVPRATRLLRDPRRRLPAAMALAGIGPGGVPALVGLASSTNQWDRHAVAHGLKSARTSGREVTELLLELSRDPVPRVRRAAMRTLGELRVDPERVVPRLVELMGVGDLEDREAAVLGLTLFGPAASNALPALLSVRDQPGGGPLVPGAAIAVEAIRGVKVGDLP